MKIYLLGSVAAFIFFTVTGGIGIVIIIPSLLAFRYVTLKANLLFTQSFLFLKRYWETEGDIPLVNYEANALKPWVSRKYISEALKYADIKCDGSKLAVLEQAEALGFISSNPSSRHIYESL